MKYHVFEIVCRHFMNLIYCLDNMLAWGLRFLVARSRNGVFKLNKMNVVVMVSVALHFSAHVKFRHHFVYHIT